MKEGDTLTLNENHIVQKSIPLLDELRHQNLKMFELKLIEVYLSRINSHRPESRTVLFEKNELKQICGTSLHIDSLRQSLHTIRHLEVAEISEDGTRTTEKTTNLFDYSEIVHDKNGVAYIKLECSQRAMQYIFFLEDIGYLRYKLRNVIHLQSKYSYSLFLYLVQNKFRKSWRITLSDLIEILKTPYETYTEINKLILKPVLMEINSKTSLQYKYYPIKKGRVTTEIEFEIIDWGEIQKIAEEIEQEQPELLQIEEQQETKIHSGLDIDFISESCDNSFTDNQISALISVINKDNLSDADKKQYGLNIAIYNYLSRKYRLFVALEQDTVIYNRFKYFYSMIEGDTQ